MKNNFKNIISKSVVFIFLISSILISVHAEKVFASETSESILVKKVSQAYTKKFCNAIGFGLSKESAMNFSIKENYQVFNKKKGFNDINKDVLSGKIATTVVEKCGYPINLSGEEGVIEFKNYYLSKDQELLGAN
tara:strand:+ start:374 stop:778 length:405 start_codon:yes stop_codon:yes gene_type:complete